ncbi:MAG: sarcosine oxidase subunit alpha family protein [Gammaproteobacteria bacterium]
MTNAAGVNRLAECGLTDRGMPLSFTFNGARMCGLQGDTVASALLANNVRIVSRSFKYHRPRGIYGIGAEEPNAIFTIADKDGGRRTPNNRATLTTLADGMQIQSQSGYPSVHFDIGALAGAAARLLPAGFYYKTFMWPPKLWMFYEKIIRRAASSARPPADADIDKYDHRYAHADIVIIGGGPAGLAAALAASENGNAQVMLLESRPHWGGDLTDGESGEIESKPAAQWAKDAAAELASRPNVRMLLQTTAQGYHDYNYLTAMQQSPSPQVRQRLLKIRARRIIIAAGAIERPLVFAGNDMPGVMSAAAVRAYIHRYGVLCGRRILFLTNNDSAYGAAMAAHSAGARVDVADIRRHPQGHWQEKIKEKGLELHACCGIAGLSRAAGALTVRLARLSPDGSALESGGEFSSHAYDIVAASGGWTPTVHLFSQSRGKLKWDVKCGAFVPAVADALNPCVVVGAAAGVFSLSGCLKSGYDAGLAAQNINDKKSKVKKSKAPFAAAPPAEHPPFFAPLLPAPHPVGRGPGKHFVDMMNDVTAADIQLAVREGYDSAEHLKRYTAAGFGTDQGKTGNINALVLLAQCRGISPAAAGHTTYRPQYVPMSFGVVGGENRRELFAPERGTPMHSWHVQNGAVFEDVGDWKRPYCFLREGEDRAAAVRRECLAARRGAAMMDATTLGKIDIRGPDAATFLDMIYSNNIQTLQPGRARYAMMLHETGMIYDDGVCARLSAEHFHITTSTGHAAGVMNWLEEWLQTEWPHLRVFCTSVTEQWAVITLAGPKSREILKAAGADDNLTADDFGFMHIREGVVAGAPARVFRVSFSGELAFEINVPSRYGLHVWRAIHRAGLPHDIAPYGTETMRVLRAEKGYIIVGQDSDGTATPGDMNLGWMVKKKDFIGRRSLSRPDMTKGGRYQFVGLQTEDDKTPLPEGAYLLADKDAALPCDAEGFVTSSYLSATLERPIALAMIKNGLSRSGEMLYAALPDGSRPAARITSPVFYDKEGKRRDGN